MEKLTVVRVGTFREFALGSKPIKELVGAPGFEPGTSCAQGKRATRLRHAPFCGYLSFCQAWRQVSSAIRIWFSFSPARPCDARKTAPLISITSSLWWSSIPYL
jgi:hypothetical protein